MDLMRLALLTAFRTFACKRNRPIWPFGSREDDIKRKKSASYAAIGVTLCDFLHLGNRSPKAWQHNTNVIMTVSSWVIIIIVSNSFVLFRWRRLNFVPQNSTIVRKTMDLFLFVCLFADLFVCDVFFLLLLYGCWQLVSMSFSSTEMMCTLCAAIHRNYILSCFVTALYFVHTLNDTEKKMAEKKDETPIGRTVCWSCMTVHWMALIFKEDLFTATPLIASRVRLFF